MGSGTNNEPATELEPLAVTQVQAARLLGVTDRTIRRWEKIGLLTGRRVGGVRHYSYANLKSLVLGDGNGTGK